MAHDATRKLEAADAPSDGLRTDSSHPAVRSPFGVRRAGAALSAIAVLASCSSTPGNAETDRIATVVANAISYPHLASMDAYVRAALATGAGRDSRLVVVKAEELHAHQLVDPLARIVFRIHLPASGTGFSTTDAFTACYQARFSFYGVVGTPHRIHCPIGASAIVPPPPPAKGRIVIPHGSDDALAALLATLPGTPTPDAVTAIVTSGLPAAAINPNTGLTDLPPIIDTAVDGADVGISLWDQDGGTCLLGARIGGHVSVWRPGRPSIDASDLPPCDAQSAIHLLGILQTH